MLLLIVEFCQTKYLYSHKELIKLGYSKVPPLQATSSGHLLTSMVSKDCCWLWEVGSTERGSRSKVAEREKEVDSVSMWTIDSYRSPELEDVSYVSPLLLAERADCSKYNGCLYSMRSQHISTFLAYLHSVTSKQQQAHPEGVHIIAGDFNQARLKIVLPNF